MQITISKSEFLATLLTAGKIISSKSTEPILSCFLLEAKEGRLHVTAADYSGRISTSCECNANADIRICIESKMLVESLKGLPEQPITILITENMNICIKYAGGKFEMMGKEAALYPEPKEADSPELINLTCNIFHSGISKTHFCADDNDLRPIMCGVLCESQAAQINFVSTNGNRLAILETALPDIVKKNSFVIPKNVAGILKTLVPNAEIPMTIYAGIRNAVFQFEGYSVTSRLIDGKYPNYRSVVPISNDKILTVDVALLKSAISRVAVFANQSSRLITFEMFNNQLKLAGQDIDYSTHAEEVIVCEYTSFSLTVGFNASFLSEIISNLPAGRCIISFSEPSRAVLIHPEENGEGENLTYLLMPLTIA